MFTRYYARRLCTISLVLAVALLLSSSAAFAQDHAGDGNVSDRNQAMTLSATSSSSTSSTQTSIYPVPEASDEQFIAGSGPGLDTGCTYSSGGPLVIQIEVDRYVDEVDASGYLLDPSTLLENDLLARHLELLLPAYDVDVDGGSSGTNSERDRVYFNGEPIGYLDGSNGTWQLNSFILPIDRIKFPEKAPLGSELAPATNEIKIDIDVANSSDNWCTAIDWATLRPANQSQGLAWRPSLFVHGIFSDKSIWGDPNGIPVRGEVRWRPELEDQGIETHAINVGKVASIGDNSELVEGAVEEMRAAFGVDKLNIVAHSKGGLDTRDYLQRLRRGGKDYVQELAMMGTPNAGSPIADFFFKHTGVLPLFTPALIHLTTYRMRLFNLLAAKNPGTRYLSAAGDHALSTSSPKVCTAVLIALYEEGFNYEEGNDCIVPVSSAYALNYATNVPVLATGDKYSTHTNLYNSRDIYNRIMNGGSEIEVRTSALASTSSPVPSASGSVNHGWLFGPGSH